MENINKHPLYKKYSLDNLISSLLEFYKSKFTVLFLSSLVVSVLTVIYTNKYIDMNSLQEITDPEELMLVFNDMVLPLIAIILVSLLFYMVLNHYIIHSPLDEDHNFFQSIRQSLNLVFPYLVTMVLFFFATSLAVVIGLSLLIVGIFFTMLYMCSIFLFLLPIFIVEGNNIGSAISRSIKLTHKGFWSNLGWIAIVILVYMVASLVLSAVITLPFAGNILKTLLNPESVATTVAYTSNPIYLVLSATASALLTPIFPILGTILYFNGRVKEEEC
jgi:hypothetical protein